MKGAENLNMERLDSVAKRQTVRLTHYGRKSGKPYEVTIWFAVDGDHVYVGTANVNRQWVRNVQKTPQVKLTIGGEMFEGGALSYGSGRARTGKVNHGEEVLDVLANSRAGAGSDGHRGSAGSKWMV